MADGLRDELDQMEQVLRGYEADIAKLQGKLREARARQNAIAARFESAVTRAKAREIMHGSRTADAFAKFELLERRADFAEGRCEALGITSLEDEIDQLKASRSDRRRAGSHESRAQGAGELNERKGTMTMARKIYPYSLDRKDAKVAGVCSTIGGDDRDRPDLHPHRLRRRRDLHQLQADPDRLRRDRHLPRGAEEAGR